MKLSSLHSRCRSGFTLIELLVVIAIIAILAAATIGGVSSALNSAKRAKASAAISGVQTAVLNYYTEYSVYPLPNNPAPTTDSYYSSTDASDWGTLMVALCGGVDPGNSRGGQVTNNPVPNTRQIAFMTPSYSDLDTTVHPSVLKNPFNLKSDPYYYIAIDSDYSNIIGDSNAAAMPPNFASVGNNTTSLPSGQQMSGGVAVWGNTDPGTSASGTPTNPKLWVHTY